MKQPFLNLVRKLLLPAVVLSPVLLQANLSGPYSADTNTLFLLHFDEAAGGSVTANAGTVGGNFYSVNFSAAGLNPPVVTSMLGAPGYVTNGISFTRCESNTAAGYLLGFDKNNDGVFQADQGGTGASPDAIPMSLLNIGNGSQTPFTLEALIQPTTTGGNQEIICTDSGQGSRGFQFRITSGSLQFQFITGGQAVTATIPTTGSDAFVAGAWYHVALAYDGAKGTLYWTRLDPSVGAAHVLGTPATLTLGTSAGAVTGPLVIGNRGRPTGTETFLGAIDEVRISKVARAANQMQFFSPLVTITQNPISQNVDYNQPVSFSVGASSLTSLGYQWLFNSNGIPGATNATFVIPNVAAANAGNYNVVVTNTSGNSATSSVARLVVGAANFLGHRYSFTNDASDSVGGANGTLLGNAVVTSGSLVLDGSSGTYLQLPANLFNAANATALTVEFWASFGVNTANSYIFAFGNTNATIGGSYAGLTYAMFSPNNGAGHQIIVSPGDNSFNQTVSGAGVLDGLTRHIACVIDPPNKTLAIYTNGVLESVNTNLTVNISSLNDALSWVGRSLFPADPYTVASIDELRIFNGALSSISIKQSDDQGPNVVLAGGPAKFVTQPASTSVALGQLATFTASTVGYLPISYQWYKNGVPVVGANNATYSFTTALTDNNSTVYVVATNTIGVTTYVTNSATATLSVYVPPTLAWLGSVAGGADGSWNTNSLDWTTVAAGGGLLAFAQNDGVLLDDRAAGGTTLDLGQPIVPYNIKANATADYLLTSSAGNGLLTGQGTVTKLNTGALILDVTNNLSGAVLISGGKLQVGNGDTYGTLGSGPVTNNATLSFNRADAVLNVGNAIHGTGTVSFEGTGTVAISGPNDYSGSTLVNQVILNLLSGSGLGTGAAAVASGGQVYITANVNISNPLTISGVGPDNNGALRKGGAGVTIDSGTVTMLADSTIGLDGGATLVLSNTVSGVAALTAIGGGNLTLAAANTFQNGFTLNGSVIGLNASGALGTGPVTVSGAGRFVLADGVTFTNSIVASTVNPGVGNGILMVNDNTNGTVTTVSGPLEFDASPASGGNFVGPITSGYLNVTGPVTNTTTGVMSVRNGRVRFAGGGNYSTFNLSGTCSLGANNGLSPAATLMVGVSGTATFDLNGFSQTLAGLADGAAFAELVTNSAASASTLTLLAPPSSVYSGVLAGPLNLVVNGGYQTLNGTNSNTGNTTVISNGVLSLAVASLPASGTVTLATGGQLTLAFAGTNTVAGLVLDGVNASAGVHNSTTDPSYLTGGSGSLLVVSVAPNPTPIIATVSGGNLSLAWAADHLGWILQSQTNSLSTGLSNQWVDVPGSSSVTSTVIPVNPANPAVFYRLRHP